MPPRLLIPFFLFLSLQGWGQENFLFIADKKYSFSEEPITNTKNTQLITQKKVKEFNFIGKDILRSDSVTLFTINGELIMITHEISDTITVFNFLDSLNVSSFKANDFKVFFKGEDCPVSKFTILDNVTGHYVYVNTGKELKSSAEMINEFLVSYSKGTRFLLYGIMFYSPSTKSNFSLDLSFLIHR